MESHRLPPAVFTRAAALKLVQDFAAELRTLVPVRQVILFGSYAHGTPHQWSDVDVAVIADQFVNAAYHDVTPFTQVLWKYPDIEPHTFSTTRFANEAGDPFIETIKRTGIVVA